MREKKAKPEYSGKTWSAFRGLEIPTPDADDLCLYRECYRVGEDKGSYSQGRGYTSYYAEPRPVCVTRMCHGCPLGPLAPGGSRMRPSPPWVKVVEGLEARLREARTEAQRRRAHQHVSRALRLMQGYLALVPSSEVGPQHERFEDTLP